MDDRELEIILKLRDMMSQELSKATQNVNKFADNSKRSFNSASQSVDNFARSLKSTGGEVIRFSRSMSFLGAAIVAPFALAQKQMDKFSYAVQINNKQMGDAFMSLQKVIAEATLPVFQQLTNSLAKIVNFVKDMNPVMRDTVLQWTLWSGVILAAAGAMGLFVGHLIKFGGQIVSVLKWVWAFKLEILAIIAAIAALTYAIDKLTGGKLTAWMQDFVNKWKGASTQINSVTKDLQIRFAELSTQFADKMADAFDQTLWEGKSFAESLKAVFRDLIRDITKDMMKTAMRNLMNALVSGVTGQPMQWDKGTGIGGLLVSTMAQKVSGGVGGLFGGGGTSSAPSSVGSSIFGSLASSVGKMIPSMAASPDIKTLSSAAQGNLASMGVVGGVGSVASGLAKSKVMNTGWGGFFSNPMGWIGSQIGGNLQSSGVAEASTSTIRASMEAGDVAIRQTKATSEAMANLQGSTKGLDSAVSGTKSSFSGLLEGVKGFASSVLQAGQGLVQGLGGILQNVFGSLGGSLAGFAKGGANYLGSLVSGIAGGIGNWVSGGMSGIGGFLGGIGSFFGGLFHEGGLVTPMGRMPFAGIPRYHGGGMAGLRPDEVPAILQTGEAVLSRSQVASARSASVVNNSYVINAIDTATFYDYVRRNPNAILDVVNNDIMRDGKTRNSVRRFG